MNLYTEEQIFKYLLEHKTIDLYAFILDMKPIELPSDEEIQDESGKYYDNNAAKAHDYYFELGAKWMRDKIGGEQ